MMKEKIKTMANKIFLTFEWLIRDLKLFERLIRNLLYNISTVLIHFEKVGLGCDC
jgi:hypothetical protein